MKNKNGFTLVELLAVIVILALLISVAVPSTISISNKLKENMFCKKIDSIETAAKLYGEDRKESFTSTYEGNRSRTITVKDLIDSNDLKKDNSEAPYIIDPRNNEGMDAISIIIYEKYNRIYVHFNDEINSICDK